MQSCEKYPWALHLSGFQMSGKNVTITPTKSDSVTLRQPRKASSSVAQSVSHLCSDSFKIFSAKIKPVAEGLVWLKGRVVCCCFLLINQEAPHGSAVHSGNISRQSAHQPLQWEWELLTTVPRIYLSGGSVKSRPCRVCLFSNNNRKKLDCTLFWGRAPLQQSKHNLVDSHSLMLSLLGCLTCKSQRPQEQREQSKYQNHQSKLFKAL